MAMWRFEDPDCRLTETEKQQLVVFTTQQSEVLWSSMVSSQAQHPFTGALDDYTQTSRTELDFDNVTAGQAYFSKLLEKDRFLFFFWGASSALLVEKSIFLKSWDDFFYPSDESSLLIGLKSCVLISSFDEFFMTYIYN